MRFGWRLWNYIYIPWNLKLHNKKIPSISQLLGWRTGVVDIIRKTFRNPKYTLGKTSHLKEKNAITIRPNYPGSKERERESHRPLNRRRSPVAQRGRLTTTPVAQRETHQGHSTVNVAVALPHSMIAALPPWLDSQTLSTNSNPRVSKPITNKSFSLYIYNPNLGLAQFNL